MKRLERAARDLDRGRPFRDTAPRARRQNGKVTPLVELSASPTPTTTPAPPRRGSPAAASGRRRASRRRPRRRRRGCAAASARRRSRAPEPVELGGVVPALAMEVRLVDVDARASIASPTPSPCADTLTTTCMIAPRSRAEPALPTTSRGRRRAERDRRRHHARQPPAGCGGPSPTRSYSPSMLFRWMPVPGTITPEPDPVDVESDAAFPSRVDHRDVRRAAGRRRSDCTGSAPRSPGAAPRPTRRAAAAASPPRWSASREAAARARALLPHHLGERSDASARARPPVAAALEQREPVRDQHAARRRRRVRDRRRARGTTHDRPRQTTGSGEVVERQLAAAVAHRRDDRPRPLAAVERRRAAAAIASNVSARSGRRRVSPATRRAPSARL